MVDQHVLRIYFVSAREILESHVYALMPACLPAAFHFKLLIPKFVAALASFIGLVSIMFPQTTPLYSTYIGSYAGAGCKMLLKTECDRIHLCSILAFYSFCVCYVFVFHCVWRFFNFPGNCRIRSICPIPSLI